MMSVGTTILYCDYSSVQHGVRIQDTTPTTLYTRDLPGYAFRPVVVAIQNPGSFSLSGLIMNQIVRTKKTSIRRVIPSDPNQQFQENIFSVQKSGPESVRKELNRVFGPL